MPTALTDGSSTRDVPAAVTIHTKSRADAYRYRCPRGHTNWEPTNHHFYCQSCARAWDIDPAFTALVDARTGEEIPRSRIHFTER